MADRSPFPGMDPWLEASWGDVHHELISEMRRQLVPQLPDDLFAVVEETVYVAVDDWGKQAYRPDVQVFTPDPRPVRPVVANATASAAEPVRLVVQDEPVTEGRIEIRHLGSGDLIVTATVMSPKNKLSADGRSAYLAKRRQYRRAGVNLVEVDLLRSGPELTGLPLGPRLWSAYRCVIRRPLAAGGTAFDVYPISLRERLPAVAVPQRPGPPPVAVDLQPPIDLIYRLGGYGRRIDYSLPPDPPLSADDAAWAAQCVAAARAV
jgi:hypothetical protein